MGEVQANFFCPNLKPMHNLFSMGKTNKGLGENKTLRRVFKASLSSNPYIYIYLEPKVVVLLLHGIVTTTYFIQWKHHWRYFNLKNGSFACKWRKLPNILHAKTCFQQKNKKTLKCFMWRSYIKILWTNFLCVFVSALQNTIYPLTLAFASIL